jgi:23S rRNA (cytidine1920-2'-O)/16S rRNA (cytidine1409-2'-O)-methyltransferase
VKADPPHPFVSRAGLKLRHALDTFGVDPRGLACADLGCNVGGFADCLLRAGASRVYAVDTGYGVLAWSLRNDARVVVMERTNALHAAPPVGGVDLVVIDLGWTPQRLCIPAALRWLRAGGAGRIITLIKPQYEQAGPRRAAVLDDEKAAQIVAGVLGAMPALGVRVLAHAPSPIRGGASGRAGNPEHLALLAPAALTPCLQ